MRKTYDRKFKLKISQDILEKKVTTKKIAEEYNISRPTISRWVSEYRGYGKNAFAGQGKRLPDKADFYILEQENKRLKEEDRVFYEHKDGYGSPGITQKLYDEGIEINKRVVAVLMREMNLCTRGFHQRKSSHGREKTIKEMVKKC